MTALANLDLGPVWLSIELAGVTTLLLLMIATPVALWLTYGRARYRPVVEATVTLPLVLPPTVLGFYLLVVLGPHGLFGAPWRALTGEGLTFSFAGLVVASIVYSLPFAVQPLHLSFETVGRKPLEAAWTLGASRLDAFVTVLVPLAGRGYITAMVLTFMHTLGEFGVVLMVGGSIPGETKVLSIEIYDRVEMIDYATAHTLSAALLIVSFLVLLLVYHINRSRTPRLL